MPVLLNRIREPGNESLCDSNKFLVIIALPQLFQRDVYLNSEKTIECVGSCDQEPYLHNETKGGKLEFNPQKNISLPQDGRRFFVFSSNMAAVTSFEHTL